MAAASSSMGQESDMLSNIMDLVTCSLCSKKDLSSILKVLPCFYSACSPCLRRQLRNVSQGRKFKCPGCSNVHIMPESGVDGFEDNSFSVNMKFLSGILSNNPPKCNACEVIGEYTPSATYCLLCQDHFCQIDGRKHMATPGHKVVTHSELCSNRVMPKLLAANSGRCVDLRIHEDPKPFQHYCIQCQILTCGECLSYKHEGHQKMPLKQAGEIYRGKLKEEVAVITKKRKERGKQMKDLKQNLTGIVQSRNTTAEKITSYGNRIKEIVDKLIQEEIANLDREANEAEAVVKKVLDQASTDETRLGVAMAHMETFLKNSSDVNVLLKFKCFARNLKECRETVEELKPIVNKPLPLDFMIEGDINSHLQQMILGKELKATEVTESPFKGDVCGVFADHKCKEIIGVKLEDTEEYAFEILSKELKEIFELFKGSSVQELDPDLTGIAIHNHLLYLYDDKKYKVVVFDWNGKTKRNIKLPKEDKRRPGLFQRMFGKTKRNDGVLGLAVNEVNSDLYISSMNTNTIYKCSATQTEAKVFIYTGLNDPFVSCVIPNKGLVVSNVDSCEIHMYDFEGALLWKYGNEGSRDKEFDRPAGICVDHLGNIFVADSGNKRLHYVSSNGQLLKHIDVEGSPIHLALMNKRLFITVCYENDIAECLILKCNYV